MKPLTDQQRKTLYYKAQLWLKLRSSGPEGRKINEINCIDDCKHYQKCYDIASNLKDSEKVAFAREKFVLRMRFAFLWSDKLPGACYGHLWNEEEIND